MLLGGTITLFLGTVLSDVAYATSYQVQWTNFASWLIAGGLVVAGLTLLWAVVDLVRTPHRGGRALAYPALLLATWILGLINALVHARDAWGVMPEGVILSVIVFVLAGSAAWFGLSGRRAGGAQ